MNLNPSWDMSISSLPAALAACQAGIWDWLQEEAPQMLPMLLRLVRQALPPPPAVTWQRRSIELGIKHPPSQLTVTIVTVTTRITSTVYIHFTYCIFLQGIPINFPLLLWSKASPASPAMRFLPRKVCTSWRRNCHRLPWLIPWKWRNPSVQMELNDQMSCPFMSGIPEMMVWELVDVVGPEKKGVGPRLR